MSVLRFASRAGVVLVDLGPSAARQHGYVASASNRGYIVAGTLAVPESEAAKHRREMREYKARLRTRGEA